MPDPKQIFENLKAQAQPGAPTEKAAISEDDSAAVKIFKNLQKKSSGFAPHSQQVQESQYDNDFVAGEDPQQHFAQRQGKWAEAGNATMQILTNIGPGLVGNLAALDPRDWGSGLIENEEQIGNALTRWANDWKQRTNQEWFPIYEQNPDKTLNLGSSEWWFKNGSGVVESAAEFALLGFGLGAGITKGLSASKWLSTVETAAGATQGAVKLNQTGQAIGVGLNTLFLNQAESILEATQVYDTELKANMQLVKEGKLTEREAKIRAASAAGHTVNLNRMNILLNLSSVSSIMKGYRGSRALVSSLPVAAKVGLEGGQEYLEEIVNFYASNRGLEKGQALREGKEYTGATVNKFIDDAFSAKGVEAGFLGMLGGVAQTGLTEGINAARGVNAEEKAWGEKQKAYIAELDALRAENKLSSLKNSTLAAEKISHFILERDRLEKKINDDFTSGREVDKMDVMALQKLKQGLQVQQMLYNFQLGTTEHLEKIYQELAGLSQEDAVKHGFTGAELDPKSPSYYKTQAQEMLNNIKKFEPVYNRVQSKLNADELFVKKAEISQTENEIEYFDKQEAEAALEAQKAISRLERSTKLQGFSGALNLTNLEDPEYYKQVGNINDETQLEARKELIEKAKQLPEVQKLKKLQDTKAKLQEIVDAEEQEFSVMSSQATQDKIRAEIKAKKEAEEKELINQQQQALQNEQTLEANKVKLREVQKEKTEALRKEHTGSPEAKVTPEQFDSLAKIADADVNTAEGTEVTHTEQEEALIQAHPELYTKLLQSAIRVTEHSKNPKPNPMVYTESDDSVVLDEFIGDNGSVLPLDAKIAKPGKQSKKGLLKTAHNVLGWLARKYKETSPGKQKDIDNDLNELMQDPTILDARKLKVGDEVVIKIDPDSPVTYIDKQGNTVTKPWSQIESDFANDAAGAVKLAPIAVFRKGESKPVAHIHLPEWIKSSNTEGDTKTLEEERKKLFKIREAVVAAGDKGVATKISQRTLGKLFISHDRQGASVATNLPDPDLEYTVFVNNQVMATDKNGGATDKTIVNLGSLKNGYSYVLLPVEKNVNPKLTKYWAVPLKMNKISEEVADSIVAATEVFLRAIDGTNTAEDNKLAEELIAMQKTAVSEKGPINFDIRTLEGIRNYTELFIYNHTKGNVGHISLNSYFLQRFNSLSSDYHAHEFGYKGLYFGSGQVGITPNTGHAEYMQKWKEHLLKRLHHTDLKSLNNPTVKVPLIKNNTVQDLTPGTDYKTYLKQNAWVTNVIGHNIAKPNEAPNYIYTIQQIIEFDTTPFNLKSAAQPAITATSTLTEEEEIAIANAQSLGTEVTPATKVLSKEETEAASAKAIADSLGIDLGGLSDDSFAVWGTPEQLQSTEAAELTPLLDNEQAYQEIESAYTLPVTSDFDNVMLRSLLSKWGDDILRAYNKKVKEGKSGKKEHEILQETLASMKNMMKLLQAGSAPDSKQHKYAKYVLENWDKIHNILRYSLQRDYGFRFSKIKIQNLSEEQQTAIQDLDAEGNLIVDNEVETKSTKKEAWQVDSLTLDPVKSLSPKFRRFLGTIQDTSRTYLMFPKLNPNFRPDDLYRTLSAILADSNASYQQMINRLKQLAARDAEGNFVHPDFAFLESVVFALDGNPAVEGDTGADEQIKAEFAVSMAKHTRHMKHLLILSKRGSEFGKALYQGIIRDDNANAKAQVIREHWQHDSFYSAIAAEFTGKDLRENRLVYNKATLKTLIEEFEKALFINGKFPTRKELNENKTKVKLADFDIKGWLQAMGITLSDGTIAKLQKEGSYNAVTGKNQVYTPYEQMFYSNSGEFYNLYTFLNSIYSEKSDVFLEDKPVTTDSAAYKLSREEAEFNLTAHSSSHRSGSKTISTYGDNKYIFDRAKALGAVTEEDVDYDLLENLVKQPFAGKNSWDLKQLLVWDKETNDFKRDENNRLVLNKDGEFFKNFNVAYTSLSMLIEKGVIRSGDQALEDLDEKQRAKVKMMLFQNNGVTNSNGDRRAEFYHMTLSNKNTMLLFEKPVPAMIFEKDGTLGDAVVNDLLAYTVMPEIQRMLNYSDSHNIAGYTEGSKLFYFYPNLNNKAELFNTDKFGNRIIRGDIETNPELLDIIKAEIKATIATEKNFILKEWEQLGILNRKEGKLTDAEYLDGKYVAWVKSKMGAGISNVQIAEFLAAEMAVGYMMHNVNMFQLFTTDPATQFSQAKDENGDKIPLTVDPVASVFSTFDNVNKRLAGEISPGRDLAYEDTATHYKLGVIQDLKIPSKALKQYRKLFGEDSAVAKDYENLNSTDAVEFITLPEKLRFMRESAKLAPELIAKLDEIQDKYDAGIEARLKGQDASKYDISLEDLGLLLQVDKPIMVGTRMDNHVETKLYVKSAAFTLIPQFVRGTELEHLMLMMEESAVDRLATVSGVKLGAPKQVKKVFDDNGNFIPGSKLIPGEDSFSVPRKYLRLQQETPQKDITEISRVSQASKQLFLNVLHVKDFNYHGKSDVSGRDLYEDYLKEFKTLYQTSYEMLLKDLQAVPDVNGNLQVDAKRLAKIIEDEVITGGYPIHDLESFGIEVLPASSGKTGYRFKVPLWSAASAGRLEMFLNSIVSNKILKQKFNGYGFVLGSEAGYQFTKADDAGKTVYTSMDEVPVNIKNKIVFTDKFAPGGLKPSLINNGYNQVILPWKYQTELSEYIVNGKLDTSKFDPELLKLFGMRIPNQGPNSTAALEVVGFLPKEAGDVLIAPADFVAQMGSDFDIDKLYVYMPHHYVEDGKMYKLTASTARKQVKAKYEELKNPIPEPKPETENFGEIYDAWLDAEEVRKAELAEIQEVIESKDWTKIERKLAHNNILDIHLAINTNMNPEVQRLILQSLKPANLSAIANQLEAAKKQRKSTEFDVQQLSPVSGSYQSHKYNSSVVASVAIGTFALQNTFNALSQATEGGMRMIKAWVPDEKLGMVPIFRKLSFGQDQKSGGNISRTRTLKSGAYISNNISEMLSAALDDEKEQILGRIGVNQQNLSVTNFLLQSGFELDTIAYFLSQDSIQEYNKQFAIHNNQQKALNAVMAQEKFAFDDDIFKNRGEEPGKPSNRLLADDEDDVKSEFWGLYNSSTEELLKYIQEGPDNINFKKAQYALLVKYMDIDGNQAAELRQLQSLSNIDSAGLGSNMFESIILQEDVEALGNPLSNKILNSHQMFGEFEDIASVDAIPGKADKLLKQGYVKGNTVYFKPTTIPGFAAAYGVFTNNKLWRQHFPYTDPHVQQALNNIKASLSKEADTVFKRTDQAKKIFREMKNFLYTDMLVIGKDPAEMRKRLLYDYQTDKKDENGNFVMNESLSTILYRLQNNPEYSKLFRENLFLNNLYSKITPDTAKPKLIMFRNPNGSEATNRDIYNDVEHLVKHPVSLGMVNGKPYTTRDFIEGIFVAASVSMTSAVQLNMMQWMPVSLFTKSGLAKNLHAYDWKKLTDPISAGMPSRFTIQYFQHFPNNAASVNLNNDITEATYKHKPEDEDALEQLGVSQDEMVDRLKVPANIISFQLNLAADKSPAFLRAAIGENIHLFMLTDADTKTYTRIPTLLNSGSADSHEYNANKDIAYSAYTNLNPPGYENTFKFVPVQTPRKTKVNLTGSLPAAQQYQSVKDILAVYGITGETVDRNLTLEELNKMLTAIVEGTNKQHSFVAAWLNTMVALPSRRFHVNFKIADLGEDLNSVPISGNNLLTPELKHLQVTVNTRGIPVEHGTNGFQNIVLHELVHAVTKLAIYQGKNNKDSQVRRAYKNLKTLHEAYVEKFIKSTGKTYEQLQAEGIAAKDPQVKADFIDFYYPGKNIEEFVVAIMTNQRFREQLQKLEYNPETHESFWDKIQQIFNFILSALGVDANSTAGKAIKDVMFLSKAGNMQYSSGTKDAMFVPYSVADVNRLRGRTVLPDVSKPQAQPVTVPTSLPENSNPMDETNLGDITVAPDFWEDLEKDLGSNNLLDLAETPEVTSHDMPAIVGSVPKNKKKKVANTVQTPKAVKLMTDKYNEIEQLWKRENEIRAEMKTATGEELLNLKRRQVKVKAHIEQVKAELETIARYTKLEDVIAHGLADLQAALKAVTNVSALDLRDLNVLTKRVDIWSSAKNFLSEEEMKIPSLVQQFKEVTNLAEQVKAQLDDAKKNIIYNWVKQTSKRELTPEQLWEATRDIGYLSGELLSADNANHALLQVMFEHIKRSDAAAVEEMVQIEDEIKELLVRVKNKEHITGKNFSNFFETDSNGVLTGNLMRSYNYNYLNTKHTLIKNMQEAYQQGDFKLSRKYKAELDDFIRDNEVQFDLRKLIKLDGHEAAYEKDNGKLEAELKSILGEANYKEYLKKAKAKYEDYQIEMEMYKEYLEDHPETAGNEALINEKLDAWKKYNSVEAYWEWMSSKTPKRVNATIKGWYFSTAVPKLKNSKGESLYNEKYLKLQQDKDVAELHRYVLHLTSKLRNYMPSNLLSQFDSNALPAVQKSVLETLQTEGAVATSVSLWDKIRLRATSQDIPDLLIGGDASKRNLTIKMQTLKEKIDKLTNQKSREYLRKNDKPATEEQMQAFRKEASEEVQKEYSTDLLTLLHTYASALVTYKHKTRIEDMLRISEDMFKSQIQEEEVGADGQPRKRVIMKGVTMPELKSQPNGNQIKMISNALDRFWQLPKEVEGQMNSKVYTVKEKIQRKKLQAELDSHTAELAKITAELNKLLEEKESLSPEEMVEHTKKISLLENRISIVGPKIEEVNKELKKMGQNISGTGIVNTMIDYIIFKGLGWNLFGGITNLLVGAMANQVEAASGRWFNEAELRAGYKVALNASIKSGSMGVVMPQAAKKLSSLMQRWDILQTIHETSKNNFKPTSKLSAAAEVAHWGQVYKTTEYMNQAPVFVAMMKRFKVKNKAGKETSLWEAYTAEGKWDTKNYGNIEDVFNVEARGQFKSSVHKALSNTHGNYYKLGEIAAKRKSVGKLLTVFRSWMFEGFKNRFESKSIDYIDNTERKGRYLSYKGSSMALGLAGWGTLLIPGVGTVLGAGLGAYIGSKNMDRSRFRPEFQNMSAWEELAESTKYLIRKLSFGLAFKNTTLDDKFTEVDARNMRKNMTELSFLLTVTGFMLVLRHLADGEDDKEKKGYLMYLLNIIHRLQQDLGFYANPVTTFVVLRDPIPATGVVQDTFKFLERATEYIANPEDDIIQVGRYVGQSKLERATSKLIPGWRVKTVTESMMDQEISNY